MSAPVTFQKISRRKRYVTCGDVAESLGFEPRKPFGLPLFKTYGLFNHAVWMSFLPSLRAPRKPQ